MFLAFVCWIVVGLVVGRIASKVVRLGDDDPRLGMVAGLIGAVVAGIIFSMSSAAPSTEFNVMSLLAAATGAVVASAGWYLARAYTSRA